MAFPPPDSQPLPRFQDPAVPPTPLYPGTSAGCTAPLCCQVRAAGKSEALTLDVCREGSSARYRGLEGWSQPCCFEMPGEYLLPSAFLLLQSDSQEPEGEMGERQPGGVETKEFGSHLYKGSFLKVSQKKRKEREVQVFRRETTYSDLQEAKEGKAGTSRSQKGYLKCPVKDFCSFSSINNN